MNQLSTFLLMGRDAEQLPLIPAGCVCGIGGLTK
jgi:hypothetical protein